DTLKIFQTDKLAIPNGDAGRVIHKGVAPTKKRCVIENTNHHQEGNQEYHQCDLPLAFAACSGGFFLHCLSRCRHVSFAPFNSSSSFPRGFFGGVPRSSGVQGKTPICTKLCAKGKE